MFGLICPNDGSEMEFSGSSRSATLTASRKNLTRKPTKHVCTVCGYLEVR